MQYPRNTTHHSMWTPVEFILLFQGWSYSKALASEPGAPQRWKNLDEETSSKIMVCV